MVAPIPTCEAKPAGRTRREALREREAEPPDESIYLLGRPTLRHFLRFIGQRAIHQGRVDEGMLTDEWRAASEHIATIEKDEAGIADYPAVAALGPRLQPLRDELLKNPLITHGFNTVPANFAMVELDRKSVV